MPEKKTDAVSHVPIRNRTATGSSSTVQLRDRTASSSNSSSAEDGFSSEGMNQGYKSIGFSILILQFFKKSILILILLSNILLNIDIAQAIYCPKLKY